MLKALLHKWCGLAVPDKAVILVDGCGQMGTLSGSGTRVGTPPDMKIGLRVTLRVVCLNRVIGIA